VVIDADSGEVVDVNENAVAFFGRTRAHLLASERDSFGPPLQPNGRPTRELAWISALRPRAKVVYMSGYTDADGASGAIARGAELIAKPFTPSALIAKLRAVLDG
jgi:hypothetical protein